MRATLFLCVAFCAYGQYSGNVTGVIRDAATRQPIRGAAVVIVGPGEKQGRTGADGRFLINAVPVGYPASIYSVVASAPGYQPQVLKEIRVLPGAVMAVECAFALSRGGSIGTSVGRASFTYSHERAVPLSRARAAEAGQIFATREGLVGRTTANGHVIKADDRFVALPSRRALNAKGVSKLQVRLRNGSRTATVPVWDIGPWNIRDDYWNEASERENWRGLPRGLPQAQAAFLDGHNGGKDGFGRKVMNPAGIDLSDAVFWKDLGMKDNGWITVEYLWDPTLISSREPASQPRREPRRSRPRSLQELIAIAQAVLLGVRW
jgi:Carboxypeptidase regulatory-like domain